MGRLHVWVLLGVCLFASAAQADSEETAAKLLKSGQDLLSQGKLTEAEVILRQAMQLAPEKGAPHYWLGKTLVQLDRCREAIGELELYLQRTKQGKLIADAASLVTQCREKETRRVAAEQETLVARQAEEQRENEARKRERERERVGLGFLAFASAGLVVGDDDGDGGSIAAGGEHRPIPAIAYGLQVSYAWVSGRDASPVVTSVCATLAAYPGWRKLLDSPIPWLGVRVRGGVGLTEVHSNAVYDKGVHVFASLDLTASLGAGFFIGMELSYNSAVDFAWFGGVWAAKYRFYR